MDGNIHLTWLLGKLRCVYMPLPHAWQSKNYSSFPLPSPKVKRDLANGLFKERRVCEVASVMSESLRSLLCP